MTFNKQGKKWCIAIVFCVCLIGVLVCVRLIVTKSKPVVYFSEANLLPGEETTVDVCVSNLNGEYPAASFQILFDKNKLEFLEIKQGNIEIQNLKTGDTLIPTWNYSQEKANQKGVISTMYLDMTGEDNPIAGEHISQDHQVLFRVQLRAKDSCNLGEILKIDMQHATFAAVDEVNTLATYQNNIDIREGRIKIKE